MPLAAERQAVRPAGAMTRLHRVLGAVAVSLCGIVATACENRSPASLFEGCIRAGIRTLQQSGEQTTIDCTVEGRSLLVGLPGRRVTAGELAAVGVSRNIGELLASSQNTSNRWCAVEDLEREPMPPAVDHAEVPVARSECVSTDVEIPHVVQTHSRRVVATVALSSAGRVTPVRLEGQ